MNTAFIFSTYSDRQLIATFKNSNKDAERTEEQIKFDEAVVRECIRRGI